MAALSIGEGEEAAMAQDGEDGALHDLHGHFDLGLVAGACAPAWGRRRRRSDWPCPDKWGSDPVS